MNQFSISLHKNESRRLTGIWMLLLLITWCSFYFGSRLKGKSLMFAVLALALVKAAWVAYDFMGLRRTYLVWRLLMGFWLLAVGSFIALAYLSVL